MRNAFLRVASSCIFTFAAIMTHAAVGAASPRADRPAHQLVTLAHPAPGKTYPLVVVLHGYGVSGDMQEYYYSFRERAEAREFYVLVPEGRLLGGKPYWDTSVRDTDALGRESDFAYVRRLIAEAQSAYPIDPARIYVVGHSNGGYFASALACGLGDVITGVAAVSGAEAGTACRGTRLAQVLAVCGTNDSCTGAEAITSFWGKKFGCGGMTSEAAPSLDLDWTIKGADTVRARAACPAGKDVSQWTMLEGAHVPRLKGTFADAVLDHFGIGARGTGH